MVDKELPLGGKTALVTGGTGAIGAAICRTMAAQGASVAFTYRKKADVAEALLGELSQQGCKCLTGAVDATDAKAIERFVGKVEEELASVDVLVNNLGATEVMPFALIEEEDWHQVIQVNLTSMFLFSKAVVRNMIRRRSGAIVNIGSVAGHRLLEVPVHYATAKAGVTGFTLSLAKELSRYNIRVNAVAPGLITGGIGKNVSERQLEDYNRFCSLSRPGEPTEVAELVAFVASDRGSYINAQNLVVDGGL